MNSPLMLYRRAAGVGRDAGGISILLAVVAMILLIAIGVVADGKGALDASARASADAQEAARAGAQQIDPARAITGTGIVLDPAAAAAAARAHLTAVGQTGSVEVAEDGSRITVHVTGTYRTRFSSMLGLTSISVRGTGHAQPIHQGG